MADITASATGNPTVESLPEDQLTLNTAADITALDAIYVNSSGLWAKADADSAGTASMVYIALRTCKSGESLTGTRKGIVDGLALADMAYGDPIYLSGTAGKWQDEVGSTQVEVLAARVIPATGHNIGTTANKLAKFDIPL